VVDIQVLEQVDKVDMSQEDMIQVLEDTVLVECVLELVGMFQLVDKIQVDVILEGEFQMDRVNQLQCGDVHHVYVPYHHVCVPEKNPNIYLLINLASVNKNGRKK